MTDSPVSVIVSFYNRIDYLRLILAALEHQTFRTFEIVIADDGSTEEVVEEIKAVAENFPIPIRHVWHEDAGFRKTTILNKAVVESVGEYLIFMDGDCIPHHRFVEEHYSNRRTNVILAGRRANVSPKVARLLNVEKIRSGFIENGFQRRVVLDGLMGKSHHVIKGWYVKSAFLRKFLNRKITGVLGSNFSIHKKDLLAVNGFDERYHAPAVGEDTDLEMRLRWSGVEIQMIKNMAVQYHIDHPKLKRSEANMAIFEEVLRDRIAFTPYGINRMK
jgi:glycosyltransferase involved in cell wall biosynthesis